MTPLQQERLGPVRAIALAVVVAFGLALLILVQFGLPTLAVVLVLRLCGVL